MMFPSAEKYLFNHDAARAYCLLRAADAIELMAEMREAMAQPMCDRHFFTLYGHNLGECDGEWAIARNGHHSSITSFLTLQMVVAWILATNW
jgi:hypothetical protein